MGDEKSTKVTICSKEGLRNWENPKTALGLIMLIWSTQKLYLRGLLQTTT